MQLQGDRGGKLQGLKARCFFGIPFLLALLFIPFRASDAQEAANYLNKAWRDSVANYRGRVEAYHQELDSYDWGMTFGMLPVAGEAYVGKLGTGLLYSGARGAALAVGTVGAIRLIGGKPSIATDLGMIGAGLVGYVALKLLELANIRHEVSHQNERLVQEFDIATPDIMPHSIRYPTRQWPDSVTSWPPIPPG